MIGPMITDCHIMTESILYHSHLQSGGRVFLLHHENLCKKKGGTSRNTQMQQSPISVMSQDQLMVQRMLLLMKLMTRLGQGASPPILKRFLRSSYKRFFLITRHC